ncbi:SseB family protein [Spirillospora sp. NPDC048911]|uniref:TY-Chap domain-containing protein n=1 Tax=Spirillospora sp. NPDC048911 TaxID=3364527 RepID=UPI00371C69C9
MDWDDFAKRLAIELMRLPVRSFLILQKPGGLPYAQVMRSPDALDAEAVSSAFLPRPLNGHQERLLTNLGWRPPNDRDRHNWWHRAAVADRSGRPLDDLSATCERMAGRMAAAFRDVHGVGSPLELVYQASRSGPDGGPLALPGLGIPLAIPDDEAPEEDDEGASDADLEAALAEARDRGDQRGYLDLLAGTALYLPVPGDPSRTEHHYATAQFGDGTFVLAFTSPDAMDRSLRGQAVHHRPATLAELAVHWPRPEWQLAINPGLPSAAYLDADLLQSAPHEASQAAPRGAEPDRETAARPVRETAAPLAENTAPPVPVREVAPPAPEPVASVVSPPPVRETAPPRVPEPVPPPVRESAPPPLRDIGLPPMRERVPTPAGESATPSTPEATRPPVQETAAPPVRESTAPAVRENVPPPVREDAAPPVPQSAPPVRESAPPPVRESAPPVRESAAPPVREASTAAPRRESAPPVDANFVVMQKVVRPEHVSHYLDGGYEWVAGYVHRLQDVAELNTPQLLVRALGLVYEGSPFSARDEDIYVIRWPAVKPALFRLPLGGIDEWSMGIIPGGWVIEKAPFPGSGYAPGDGPAIPEFKVDSQRLPHGSEIYRLDRSGVEALVAGYDADRRRWVRVEGGL